MSGSLRLRRGVRLPDEIRENVRYALRSGMPGGGYIFSTSNCVYTGLPLERYEIMLDTWRTEGIY